MTRIAIIGGGAAGCFCAVNLRRMLPEAHITIFEAGARLLRKVAVTGGGRCNLTNTFDGTASLSEAYPRGERLMKRALKQFSQNDTCEWFRSAGVPLVVQEDHCVFPASQDAMTIVRCLENGLRGVEIRLSSPVLSTEPGFRITTPSGVFGADIAVVTTGGSPKSSGICFLEPLGLETVPPVPSLFAFTVEDASLRSLMGLVVPVRIGLEGSAFHSSADMLITDWGLSGPAVLRLSSYGARYLAERNYKCGLLVNWSGMSENELREKLRLTGEDSPQKQISNTPLLPSRLWAHIMERAQLRADIRWAELGSKGLNRLLSRLTADRYEITGRNPFREEFVTCGGVALSNIDLSSLECKRHPGLYFCGEVLDIDAITGGFNLQAAWSTGYVAARSIAARLG